MKSILFFMVATTTQVATTNSMMILVPPSTTSIRTTAPHAAGTRRNVMMRKSIAREQEPFMKKKKKNISKQHSTTLMMMINRCIMNTVSCSSSTQLFNANRASSLDDDDYDDDGESSNTSTDDNFTKDSNYYDDELPTDFGLKTSLPDSQYTQVLFTNNLQSVAEKMRQFYDDHFWDPRQPNANRFVWDPWYVNVGDILKGTNTDQSESNMDVSTSSTLTKTDDEVPGEHEATLAQTQYSLKRIQCNNFFTEPDFSILVEELTLLGRSIGLTAITPPWMSMYTHGDMQNFHTDAPQGPMAFVLSLSKEHQFQGGETMLLRPNIMEMWKGFYGSVGLEAGQILRFIPPTPLGRFIAFDPRVPHGVNRVSGMQGNGNDPRYARVVIHGWYNQPEVCWFGPWDENSKMQDLQGMLDETLQGIVDILDSGEIGRAVGYLACKLDIDEDGEVVNVLGVCDTLQADWEDYRGIIGYDEADRPVMEDATSDIKLTIYENLKNLHFGAGKKGRSIVVPFLFE